MHFIPSILLFLGVAICVGAVPEKAHPTGHHERHDPMDVPKEVDGHHNPEYDEEAMLGTHDISGLTKEELEEKLSELFVQHDKDKDNHVNKDELIKWMLDSFRHMDEEESSLTFKKDDLDQNEHVTWEELVRSQYSMELDDVKKLSKEGEDKHTHQMIIEDEKRFKGADLNKDGQLDSKEYMAFYHPYDYDHMHIFEIRRELEDRDKNGDDKLNLDEFIGDGEHVDDEFRKEEEKRFKEYDTNGDGQLDIEEMRKYLVPDNTETATEEATHLIGECDKDNDNILSKTEVIDCVEAFKDVQAITNIPRDEL